MADRGAGRNLKSRLKRRRRAGNPMQAYDALPPPLRQWLAAACLPWSPASALRIWTKAGGSRDPAAAAARLDAAEQAMLERDARVWAVRAQRRGKPA
ncbi:DUF6525 family protein [Leisingera aquaemixtae]|uniref:Uncharacterized protein n=1 Tax=Leisingera aquaemixtae TaxID=1396826 RepID=A0A0P1HA75_9RHOB|nr:DUF6525 family protein [Leisingera aquaemixtae]UWQ24283.1 hypothetical protein K3553_15165 [Leisingera aquaemixtae]UWQ40918.1 hypothetical protein K3718_15445 [Leisingera aquaemixtae]UWQ45188.1 hypothetical protein K3719_15620 [Leisingera aquaemixtae]CUI00131.1 hypothetical protein PHA8399_02257 [Leisingera aquaemixtae]